MEELHKMGWLPDLPTGPRRAQLAWKPGPMTAAPGFVPKVEGGLLNMSAVELQNTNDCVARAVVGALEYLQKKSLIDKKNYFELSSRFLYYAARTVTGRQNVDGGTFLNDGITESYNYGVPWEGMCPNDAFMVNSKPTEEAYNDERRVYLDKYAFIETGDINSMMKALIERTPIVFGFVVFQHFYVSGPDANGMMPMPQPNEVYVGGHAACLCRYDQRKNAFLVRNSWGDTWGQAGYFWMPFQFIAAGYAANFCALQSIRAPYPLA